jgi:hypothetical protein
MERVEGRPDLSTAESPEEARTVLDDFVDLLARMHQIDIEAFADLGLKVPRNAEAIALGDLDHCLSGLTPTPPRLVGAAGRPRTLREISRYVDRIGVQPNAPATRGGAVDIGIAAAIQESDVRDAVL